MIAGGGLAGLTVASLLSEDDDISVLVIEAGYSRHEDPLVYNVRPYGQAFNTELDYAFSSTPLSFSDQRTLKLAGVKMLGGSGSLNGASWTEGPETQYAQLPMLTGDDFWSFDIFNEYVLRAEKFDPQTVLNMRKGHNIFICIMATVAELKSLSHLAYLVRFSLRPSRRHSISNKV